MLSKEVLTMKLKVQEKGLSNNMQEYVVQNLAPRYHVELVLGQFLLAGLRARHRRRKDSALDLSLP